MIQRIDQWIKHPLTGIIAGVTISLLLFWASQREVSPMYSINTPRLLAAITNETPNLQLLWDGDEIENIYSADILIWNAGRDYIDNQRISSTNPIRIEYNNSTKILYSVFSKTSRENLKFSSSVSDEEKLILVDLIGDEALEIGDGGLLTLLFTSSNLEYPYFIVQGRIKGDRIGFKRVDWADINSRNLSSVNSLLNLLIVFGMACYVFFLLRGLTAKLLKGDKLGGLEFFDFFSVLILAPYSIYAGFTLLGPFFYGVNWL